MLAKGEALVHTRPVDRHVWLQVARGKVQANGYMMEQGDGAASSDDELFLISGNEQAEVFLFDLA